MLQVLCIKWVCLPRPSVVTQVVQSANAKQIGNSESMKGLFRTAYMMSANEIPHTTNWRAMMSTLLPVSRTMASYNRKCRANGHHLSQTSITAILESFGDAISNDVRDKSSGYARILSDSRWVHWHKSTNLLFGIHHDDCTVTTEIWCPVCGDVVSSLRDVSSHYREHCEHGIAVIQCLVKHCDSTFNIISSYTAHMSRMHKTYLLTVCELNCFSKSELKNQRLAMKWLLQTILILTHQTKCCISFVKNEGRILPAETLSWN